MKATVMRLSIILVILGGGCTDTTAPTPIDYRIAVATSGTLKILRPDGTLDVEIPCSPDCLYQFPLWSPDGSKLAIEASLTRNGQFYTALKVANADGSASFTMDSSLTSCVYYHSQCVYFPHHFDPDWSSDSRRLAYLRDDSSIVLSTADGTARQTLHPAPAGILALTPRWGPNDATITFLTGMGYLGSVDAKDGSNLRQIGSFVVSSYAWSPDKSMLAVQDNNSALFVLDPITNVARQLGANRTNWGLSWSPRSDALAFSNLSDSLFVISMSGALTLVATDQPTGDLRLVDPRWTPDGRHLVVADHLVGGDDLKEISITGSRRLITSGSVGGFSIRRSP